MYHEYRRLMKFWEPEAGTHSKEELLNLSPRELPVQERLRVQITEKKTHKEKLL